jgi:hypothetical protein
MFFSKIWMGSQWSAGPDEVTCLSLLDACCESVIFETHCLSHLQAGPGSHYGFASWTGSFYRIREGTEARCATEWQLLHTKRSRRISPPCAAQSLEFWALIVKSDGTRENSRRQLLVVAISLLSAALDTRRRL